jgi:hypothetical protein
MRSIWYKANDCGEMKAGESEMSRKVNAIRKMAEVDTG